MPLPPPKDLEIRHDVKGGSPRTPSGGVKVAEYQEYVQTTNDVGYVNKLLLAATTGLAGLFCGAMLAWWTAFQGKGISQREMQDYVTNYYTAERRAVVEHTSVQDEKLGILSGKTDKMSENQSEMKVNQKETERDISEIREKMKLTANYLEEQAKPKK